MAVNISEYSKRMHRDIWKMLHFHLSILVAFYLPIVICDSNSSSSVLKQSSREWLPSKFPNPQTQPELCGGLLEEASLICDPDKILIPREARSINFVIDEIRLKSPCQCSQCSATNKGFQVAVAIVKKLNTGIADNSTSTKEIAKEFADYLLLEHWKFGTCADDLVLLVSMEDQQAHISVGSKVKSSLGRCFMGIKETFESKFDYADPATVIWQFMDSFSQLAHGNHRCQVKQVSIVRIGVTLITCICGVMFAVCCAITCCPIMEDTKYVTSSIVDEREGSKDVPLLEDSENAPQALNDSDKTTQNIDNCSLRVALMRRHQEFSKKELDQRSEHRQSPLWLPRDPNESDQTSSPSHSTSMDSLACPAKHNRSGLKHSEVELTKCRPDDHAVLINPMFYNYAK